MLVKGLPSLLVFLLAAGTEPVSSQEKSGFSDKNKVILLPAEIRLVQTISIGKEEKVRRVFFLKGQNKLIAASDHRVYLLELDTGKPLHQWPIAAKSVAVSPNGLLMATIESDGAVEIFDLTTRKLSRRFRFSGKKHEGIAKENIPGGAALAFSPDSKKLAVGCFLEVESRDIATGKLETTLPLLTGWEWGFLAFSPDSEALYYSGFPSYLTPTLNLRTGKDQTLMQLKYTYRAALSPVGSPLATSHSFGEKSDVISFWRSLSGGAQRHVSTGVAATDLAFSPDGRLLAAACDNGMTILLHVKSAQRALDICTSCQAHLCVHFSANGKFIAAGTDNGQIHIWDLTAHWQRVPDFETLSKKRLGQVWAEMAKIKENDDSYHDPIFNQLTSVPEQTIPFFFEQLKPIDAIRAEALARLIRDLSNSKYEVRDQAGQEIFQLHWVAKPALLRARRTASDLETTRRIEELLKRMDDVWRIPQLLRQYKAVRIVDAIGTPEAMKLLRRWAKGAPEAFLTKQAQERLDWRKKYDEIR